MSPPRIRTAPATSRAITITIRAGVAAQLGLLGDQPEFWNGSPLQKTLENDDEISITLSWYQVARLDLFKRLRNLGYEIDDQRKT